MSLVRGGSRVETAAISEVIPEIEGAPVESSLIDEATPMVCDVMPVKDSTVADVGALLEVLTVELVPVDEGALDESRATPVPEGSLVA